MTRKQMQDRVDDIAEFSELGDYLSMRCAPTPPGCGCASRSAGDQHRPEILLLDEGIGAVDAEFLAKARTG